MKPRVKVLVGLLLMAIVPQVGGCFFGGCFAPTTTAVNLVNAAANPVNVTLFYDDNQNISEGILEEVGQERQFRLEPGEAKSFADSCDALQAIFIQKAELSLIGDIGPSTSSRVYRDGSDFGCGDTITFTFTQSALGTDLNISFSQQG